MHTAVSRIERLRSAVPIQDVISQTIKLRPQGRSLVGRCPFHDGPSASADLHVNPSRGFYYCFACAAKGDVIGWTMRTRRATIDQALDALEQWADARADLPQAPSC